MNVLYDKEKQKLKNIVVSSCIQCITKSNDKLCINEGSGGHVMDFINYYDKTNDECLVYCGKKISTKKLDNELLFYSLITNNPNLIKNFSKFIPVFYNKICTKDNESYYSFENVGKYYKKKFDFKIGSQTYYSEENKGSKIKALRMNYIDKNTTTKNFGFRLEGPSGADFRMFNNKVVSFKDSKIEEYDYENFKKKLIKVFDNQNINNLFNEYKSDVKFIKHLKRDYIKNENILLKSSNLLLKCGKQILSSKDYKKLCIKRSRYVIHPFIIFDYLFNDMKEIDDVIQKMEEFYITIINSGSVIKIAPIGSSLLIMTGRTNDITDFTKVKMIDFAHTYIYDSSDVNTSMNGLNITMLDTINEKYVVGIKNLIVSLKVYKMYK